MNLRRARLRLTILYAVLSAIVVGGISWYAVGQASNRIHQSAEREAESVIRDLMVGQISETDVDLPPDTWAINLAGGDSESGDTDIEPPLFTLADDSGGEAGFDEFTFAGDTYLAYVQPIFDTGDVYLISAVDLGEYNADISSIRLRMWLVASGSILLAALAGYWLAGRSLKPARDALRQQRDFIADAAHELRTPLAVIQASAGHALTRDRDGDAYRRSLEEIRSAAERAGVGVGELLELARLEAGQLTPRLAPLRLDLLAEELAAASFADDVVVEAAESAPLIVDADYPLLRQAIETLVRNSVARSSHVVIATHADGRQAVLTVSDDGPGFDPEVLPHVFERFKRGDQGGSSGLGLAIAKSLVEAHGGTIRVDNRDGAGAVVTVNINLSKQA